MTNSAANLTTNLDFSEDQTMIRDAVHEFAVAELAPTARDTDEHARYPEAAMAQLAELGMLGIPLPEALGGAEAGWLGTVLAVEALSAACGTTAYAYLAQAALALGPIVALGTDEQRRGLEAVVAGESVVAFANGETAVGHDLRRLGTRARAAARGGFTISGRKPFVALAARAQHLLVSAVLADEGASEPRVVLALIPREAAGVSLGDRLSTTGVRGAEVHAVEFTDVAVAEDQVIGGEPHAVGLVHKGLAAGQVALAALSVGIAEAAREQAVAYGEARKQFDTPLRSFSAIAFKLANMDARIAAARHLVYHAARTLDAGRAGWHEALLARLTAAEAAREVTYDAIQVYGGNGYSREYPLERHWRDAKLTTLVEGSLEATRLALRDQLYA